MALAQAAAIIERQQHVMQRAMDAWDCTTHQKIDDGRLWQCMEELRGECGKQPNARIEPGRWPANLESNMEWQPIETIPTRPATPMKSSGRTAPRHRG